MENGTIIIGGRRSGKTTKLLKIASENWKYILVTNYQQARQLADTARKMGLDIPFPITVAELPLSRGAKIDDILVDNIEDVLTAIIGRRVGTITTSLDIEKWSE